MVITWIMAGSESLGEFLNSSVFEDLGVDMMLKVCRLKVREVRASRLCF